MAGGGVVLGWVLGAAVLLSVARSVPVGPSGGAFKGFLGGHRGGVPGGRHGHGCQINWKTARFGSHGIHRFIAAKAGRMSELCGKAAPRSTYCDCRPAWQCPHHARGPHTRTCRLQGYRVGYCCQQGAKDVHSTSRPTITITSILPAPVIVTEITTTTFAFRFTTTTTPPTTQPPSTVPTTGRPDRCLPLALCLVAVASSRCRLPDGSLGVICDEPIPAGPAVSPRFSSTGISEHFVVTSGGGAAFAAPTTFMAAAQAEAARAVQAQAQQAAALSAPAEDSLVRTFNLNFKSDPAEQQAGLQAFQGLLAVFALQRQTRAGGPVVQLSSQPADASQSFAAPASAGSSQPLRITDCEPEPLPVCSRSRYRAANGECNNLRHPRRGRAKIGYKRLLSSAFEDGLMALRNTSVTGRPLPGARLISQRVVETISRELGGFTLSVMQWGQFIDHDLDHALIFQLSNGGAIQCCENNGQTLPTTPLHPQCIPIEIPAYDPFYSQFRQRCMSQVRSLPAREPDCIARPATPTNQITAYLDAGNVYGNDAEEQEELRAFRGGLLRTSPGNLLPFASADKNDCTGAAEVCYRAGDSRVNEQSGLTVMHTVFTREHNRLATELRRRHPSWDDERLFQEARRVLIAEWQHIIYNEWLPIVVGFDYARDHDLLPLRRGYSSKYDPELDASISNEFATAAFRFGHSMVREIYDLINANGAVTRYVNLTSTFFNPSVVAEALVEHARTLVARRPETFDTNVVSGLHEQLFTHNFRFGLDLIALNIQRGRDHGIPTYTTVLHACSNISVTRWVDLYALMDSHAIDQLRSVYADPRDVDLFIGGLSERRARGAQVGPTFQCLIGQQFRDVRYGDRFFYDNGGMEHSFSPEQLAEIRRSSWARILCDTLGPEFWGDFSEVQPLGFLEPDIVPNVIVRCDSLAIPQVDLSVF